MASKLPPGEGPLGPSGRVAPALPGTGDDILAGSIFRGQTDRLAALFYAHRARPPHVVWSPNRHDLASDIFEEVLDHVWSLPVHAGLPLSESFDVSRAPHARWLMHLDIEGFGRDFRYLHYGAGISEYYGRDMRGRRASEFGGHISQFFIALYRAAMQRRQIVLSEHEPPRSVFVRLWRRLIVPLVDGRGFVVRFAVTNLPENHLRSGLEVVPFPVVVADADRTIRFANEPARRLAADPAAADHGAPLDGLLGPGLDLPGDPLALLAEGAGPITLRRKLALPGLDDAQVTVGAARYRGIGLFVLTIQPG